MKFNLFNWTITIKIEPRDPRAHVVKILEDNYPSGDLTNIAVKIYLIKVLRKPAVSKILIDAGLVPQDEIRTDDDGNLYIGLLEAKNFVEEYCKHLL